jgi:hypothetical protein
MVLDRSDLERRLLQAWNDLQNAGGRTAQGLENKYGQAYQELVRSGYRPQLRRKYRTVKG